MEKTFSEIIFNKYINDLSFEDIEIFFKEEQEENSILEFKSGDTSLEKLYREVCAFLNSEGGLIIIGAPKEKEVGKKKTCQGSLTNADFKSKDWLSQKITSNISPPPSGIKIIERENNGTKVFVCEVSQSINPPHQSSSDGIYYIRMEAEAKFAPHGIVMALFNKRKLPDLNITSTTNKNGGIINVNINITNKNNVPTDNLHYLLEAYNVDKTGIIKLEFVDNKEFKRLNYNGTIETPLVKGVASTIRFWLQTTKLKCVFSIMLWSREVPPIFKFYSVNVINGQIEYEGSQDSEKDLVDTLKELDSE
jgi:hypothetical protein